MSSSVGSDVFFALSFLTISILVVLLLRYYLPLRTTPSYLLVPVFLALALPSSIVLLVPIDLASSTGTDTEAARGIWLPERLLLVSWRIAYWLTFCLTWVILPLLGEYSDSGNRDPKSRLLYSLRSNARYQLIVLVTGTLGATYFFLTSGFHFLSLKALVMALAYAWGLILAIYLMGHGLVAIPKRLFRYASISGRLRRLQEQAPKVHEKMTEAMDELQEYEQQVLQLRQRKTGTAKEFQEWIEELAETTGVPESLAPPNARVASGTVSVPNVITERYLAELTRKLKRARHKRARFVDEWDSLVQRVSRTQAILDSASSKSLTFSKSRAGDAATESTNSRFTLLTPRLRYYIHTHLLPSLSLLLGAILTLASAAIIFSELVKSSPLRKLSIINLTVVHHRDESRPSINFGNQLVAATWLCYMCAAALYSISEVKIWGNRALVRRQTYPESACWYASQVAKLTVPLAYNFGEMVQRGVFEGTVFYNFMGKLINLTPLGTGFSSWFPVFVLVPVLAGLFGLYGKVKRWTGFGDYFLDDEDEEGGAVFGSGSWREGQALIERELNGPAGAASGALRLFSRDASPNPATGRGSLERNRPAPSSSSAPRRALGERSRPVERQRLIDADNEVVGEDGEEGGFFDDFMHRVRNTFDTTERPAWLDNLRPRWMDNNNSSGDEGGGGGGGLGRFFGGRAREGTLRL
ncbi:hypothetical protein NA57DRAFT_35506 [Rhizodiscina lignyota]|uniref:Uncharacterized protein n=1 Tax=Rhizodiscina lignyota TaxID=1504668 RepID=A0A9P4M927_9PEZI|nr:hypothetical protein NA57DRAFT_35506 [Rhizodiscina lignyota]